MTTVTQPRHAKVQSDRQVPALDGIRALAVGAVVTYHLGAAWLPGGFLGVDLFFVLSGFLITGLLLTEFERRGRISLSTFFARRARRLLPAFYLLLLVVCGWALLVAAPQAIGDLRGAALAALFYVANWFFIITGQSYFADMQGPSPLEHTWSLSIEEQFYLVWPLLLLLVMRKAGPRALAVATTALLAGSVVLMGLLYDAGDPSVAYFGTLSRAHELLVGCLLAFAVARGFRLSSRLQWTGWLALAGVVLMMITVTDMGAFYYRGGSLLFCALAAWLILALTPGTGVRAGPSRLFASAPLVWIGLISYGIYLWHWPLILWLTPATTGLSGLPLAGVRIAATVGIAALSYYLVELPIRSGRIRGYVLTPQRLAAIVPIAMVAMSGVIVASTVRATASANELEAIEVPSSLLGSPDPGAPVVAIAGDSVPAELMPYVEQEALARGWAVLPLAFRGCSITGTFQVDDEGRAFRWSDRCSNGLRRVQADAVATFTPDVVIWYSNRERWSYRVNGEVIAAGTPEHRQQLDEDLDAAYKRFASQGARIVIVTPVPTAPPTYGKCMAGQEALPECLLDDAYYASFDEVRSAYADLAARHPNRVTLLSVDDELCPGGRDCPLLERDGVPVRPDGIHFSPEGAAWLLPLLFDRANLATTRVTP